MAGTTRKEETMDSTHTLFARRLRLAGVAGAAALAALAAGWAVPGAAGAASPPPASVCGDTLFVNGISGTDRIALRLAPGDANTLQVDFGDDGSADASFDRTTFTHISVALGAGDDAFRVDQANGAFATEILSVDGARGNDSFAGGDGAEVFLGGSGNDSADGNRGDDTGIMGSGNDTFRWDPGDGSDTVEGRTGFDTLDFNGAGADENMQLVPNGERALFLRDVATIRMDMDGVERLDLTALGGTDTMLVDDMTGTDFRQADIDLSGPTGGGDGQVDTVTVNGTAANDHINVDAAGSRVDVRGLQTTDSIFGSEASDKLVVDARGGDDAVNVDPAVNALIGVTVNP
jgi:hypothetical protein